MSTSALSIGVCSSDDMMLLRRVLYFLYIHTMALEFDSMVAVRRRLLRGMLQLPLDHLIVRPRVYIFGWRRLRIGNHVSLNHGCFISADGGLEIGDYVAVGHGTSILTTEHSFEDPTVPIKYQPVIPLPVRIGSNVWVGANVTILAGVSIADGTVVAAGAVVTKSVELPNTVVGGVPARMLSARFTRSASGEVGEAGERAAPQ